MYSPTDALSRFLPAFSLNWVMRLSQPSRATQLNIHASSACSATWLWLNTTLVSGSIPAANSVAVTSRVAARSSSGGWGTVIACKSTMQ